MNRRDFIMALAGGIASAAAGPGGRTKQEKRMEPKKDRTGRKSVISLVKTNERSTGIAKAIDLLGINPVKGRKVLLKPNFNTADPFPGSTHNDTLIHLIEHLKRMGAAEITLGERSGPPDTADVMADKGIFDLCKKLGVGLINFEELPDDQWVRIKPGQSTWLRGFDVAKPVLDAECVVTTCCLKTHAYGGVFTMSLKLSVGVTRKRNMAELHSSFLGMRKMIAEINQAYAPGLVVLDAIEAFTDGGPGHGTRKRADVIIAGADRVAIDATGIAVLKDLGSTKDIMSRKIFDQEQISRAAEIGLGVAKAEDIEIRTGDDASRQYADRLREILATG